MKNEIVVFNSIVHIKIEGFTGSPLSLHMIEIKSKISSIFVMVNWRPLKRSKEEEDTMKVRAWSKATPQQLQLKLQAPSLLCDDHSPNKYLYPTTTTA